MKYFTTSFFFSVSVCMVRYPVNPVRLRCYLFGSDHLLLTNPTPFPRRFVVDFRGSGCLKCCCVVVVCLDLEKWRCDCVWTELLWCWDFYKKRLWLCLCWWFVRFEYDDIWVSFNVYILDFCLVIFLRCSREKFEEKVFDLKRWWERNEKVFVWFGWVNFWLISDAWISDSSLSQWLTVYL